MKLPRRNFLHLVAGAAALPVMPRIARAQTYPSRPVRIIVGFPAGGNADTIARLMVGPTQAINATLYERLNFIRDIAPVAGIISTANAIIVNPSVPAKTVPDFIAYAKVNPRKINMASGGTGAPIDAPMTGTGRDRAMRFGRIF